MLHALLLPLLFVTDPTDGLAPAQDPLQAGGTHAASGSPGIGVPCTKAIDDFAAPGNCLPASSVPMLGMLYPISQEWFVDPSTGNVGLGTTSPQTPFALKSLANADPVGITQNQVGGTSTMELTTKDGSGQQASRLVLRGNADDADIEFYAGGRGAESKTLHIKGSNGNVSIGGGNSFAKLNLEGDMRLEHQGAPRMLLDPDRLGQQIAALTLFDLAGGIVATMQNNSSPTNATISVVDGGYLIAGSYESSGGFGVVFGDVKNFRVPHPEDPTQDIVYASLEGPEAAMYVRGEAQLVDGCATVELPDHFRALALDEGMTAQLTPRSASSLGLAVVRLEPGRLEVAELGHGAGSYPFYWEVKAVRRAHQDYEVLRPWHEMRADRGKSEAEAWQDRLKVVERRAQRLSALEAGRD